MGINSGNQAWSCILRVLQRFWFYRISTVSSPIRDRCSNDPRVGKDTKPETRAS